MKRRLIGTRLAQVKNPDSPAMVRAREGSGPCARGCADEVSEGTASKRLRSERYTVGPKIYADVMVSGISQACTQEGGAR